MIPDCTLLWIAHDVMAWMRSSSGFDEANVEVVANAVRTCCTDVDRHAHTARAAAHAPVPLSITYWNPLYVNRGAHVSSPPPRAT